MTQFAMMAPFLLACPLCSQPCFQSLESLRDCLVGAATRHVICPVCQDALPGLDKFTLHLFSHSLQQQLLSCQLNGVHNPVDTADGATQTDDSFDCFVFTGSLFGDVKDEKTSARKTFRTPVVEGCIIPPAAHGCESDSFNKTVAHAAQCTVDFNLVSDFTCSGQPEKICEDVAKLRTDSNLTVNKVCDDVGTGGISPNTGKEILCTRHDVDKHEVAKGPQCNAVRLDGTSLKATLLEHPKSVDLHKAHASRCNLCGFCFPEENILMMHQQLVHPDSLSGSTSKPHPDDKRQYSCHLCSKSFKMRGSLMVHLRVAHCGNGLGAGLANKVDPGSAHEEKMFVCPACSKTFKKMWQPHLCEVELCSEACGGVLKEHQLSQHVRTHEGKQWQCDVCCKLFTTKYFLKKHKRLHTGEMPYSCGTCGKTFTFQQSYHKHLLYHSDEKPHVCQHCERAFKELSTLHNHQRIHTGEKPFACETCGKCFRQRVSYLVHRRIHTGVMPYQCTACNRSFRYKVSQRTHKCVSQTPGVLVRQPGDLVSRLQHRTQAKVSSEGISCQTVTASCVENTSLSKQAAAPVDKSVPASPRPAATTVHAEQPGGDVEAEEGGGAAKGFCDSDLPKSVAGSGRECLLMPVSNVGAESYARKGLVDSRLHSGVSESVANVSSQSSGDQSRLFVETSDFFTMVMSPCLLSPSERLRYLSLSPLPTEGAGMIHGAVSPTRQYPKDSVGVGTLGATVGTSLEVNGAERTSCSGKSLETAIQSSSMASACNIRPPSIVSCCNSLETINEESLKQLLYGSSTS